MTALGRLSLLVDGRRPPGVYRAPPSPLLPATIAAALRARGTTVWVLDTRDVRDKAGFLDRCARDLALPSWFGRNWDALVDVLRERGPGVVLWCGASALADDVTSTAIDVFTERTQSAPSFTVVLVNADAVRATVPVL